MVIADEESSANLRWAGNALTTNGVTRGRTLTVIATVDGGQGAASGVVSRSAVTADELEPLVRAAEAAAREAGPAEDAQPLVTGVPQSADFTDAPAETASEVFAAFAPALGEAFATARAGGRQLYGFAFHSVTSTYLGTSAGLRLRHDQPTGTLEVNAKSPDRHAFGVGGRGHPGLHRRGPAGAGRRAGAAAGVGGAADRAAGRAVRDAAAAVGGRGSDDLPAVVVGRPGRGRGPYGLQQGRAAAPGSARSSPTLPLTLRSDPGEPGLESAPFVVAHASGDDVVGLRQRAAARPGGLDARRHPAPVCRPPGTAPR